LECIMKCFRNFVYFVLIFDQFCVFYSGLKKHVLDGKNMFCGVVWDLVF
jgi:hypothetical protein